MSPPRHWMLPPGIALATHSAAALLPVRLPSPRPPPAAVRLNLAPTPTLAPASSSPEAAPLPPPSPARVVRARRRPVTSPLPPAPPSPIAVMEEQPEETAAEEPTPAQEPSLDEMRPLLAALATQALSFPEVTAPARGGAHAPATRAQVDLGGYGQGLSAAINARKRYPSAALRLGQQGVVLMAVVVRRDGSLAAAPQVRASSGHPVLDRQALRMVEQASPFPPLPAPLPTEAAEFTIPVHFNLHP
jgi:periplasmic protein TonB